MVQTLRPTGVLAQHDPVYNRPWDGDEKAYIAVRVLNVCNQANLPFGAPQLSPNCTMRRRKELKRATQAPQGKKSFTPHLLLRN